MAKLRRGQLVEYDGLLAAIVGVPGDPSVPDGHVALWFGEPRGLRKSQGGTGRLCAEVYTVPEDQCLSAAEPRILH